ncbi:DUF192 domain-containing protein [Patescibacteria group bacterium]|nr:DUF192 domain-containing protein [Patescibacteria group bacterium]MBU1613125.1 DUF192 domain-containing protein [Patescibacteria group bacterium]
MSTNKREIKQFNKWHLLSFVVIILVVVVLKAQSYYWPKEKVLIGGQELTVLVANNDKHLLKGWGDKKDMGLYGGMLFIYPTKTQHAIIMRDMQFPIDILWLSDGEIIDIAPNVQPEMGRAEELLTPYFARLPSNAVLELSAGFVSNNEIKIGDRVELLDK